MVLLDRATPPSQRRWGAPTEPEELRSNLEAPLTANLRAAGEHMAASYGRSKLQSPKHWMLLGYVSRCDAPLGGSGFRPSSGLTAFAIAASR